MKKRILSLIMTVVMVAGLVPAFAISAGAAEETETAITALSDGAGRIALSNIPMDTPYRLVLPDGTKTPWSVRGEYDDDTALYQPLEGGEYYLETCPLTALTLLDPETDYIPEKYDLKTQVPADQITPTQKITVAQCPDEGDNILDLAEGELLLAPSYNEYAVLANSVNLNDSNLDLGTITNAPAIRYASTDGGTTWKKLTGDITITSSSAEAVANGVRYEMYCGGYPASITLDNLNTTGTILTPPLGSTVMTVKGDVTLAGIDTDYLADLTLQGADSSAKLTVTRALSSSNIEIRDLAELNIYGRRIAINCLWGDLKLTNIAKVDITVSAATYPSCITSYLGSTVFTNVYGSIRFLNDPTGRIIETGDDKHVVINNGDSYVYAGVSPALIRPVELQADGILPAEQVMACLILSRDEIATDPSASCTKDETCPVRSFTDADAEAWYHNGIHYCVQKGILEPTAPGLFAPNAEVTEQQVWMALARISGQTAITEEQIGQWALENGLTDGTAPADTMTRQKFITLLYNYAVSKGYDVSVGEDTNILSYDDIFEAAEEAIPAIQWGCGSGVMEGCGDGTLKPTAAVTRAQLAAFLHSFCEKAVK